LAAESNAPVIPVFIRYPSVKNRENLVPDSRKVYVKFGKQISLGFFEKEKDKKRGTD
jgi:hypothetical protein